MTDAFVGSWALDRRIVDGVRSTTIGCRGDAHLQRNGATLVYHEAVSFRLSGKLIAATRAYRYADDRGSIVATFADGSPFFALRLSGEGNGTAVHPCGDDLYTLTLTLRAPDTWVTQWDVTGSKRLTITTRYRRR